MDFGKRSGDKRQSILSVGDDEYVQYSEFEFVASNLLSMAALHYSAKSGGETDVNAFASKFCSKLESCQHVLGAEYDYIRCSKYNRRAFAYSLTKLFHSIPFDEEVTVVDFHQLIELFCPDFPKDLVESAASCVEVSRKKIQRHTIFMVIFASRSSSISYMAAGSSTWTSSSKMKIVLMSLTAINYACTSMSCGKVSLN